MLYRYGSVPHVSSRASACRCEAPRIQTLITCYINILNSWYSPSSFDFCAPLINVAIDYRIIAESRNVFLPNSNLITSEIWFDVTLVSKEMTSSKLDINVVRNSKMICKCRIKFYYYCFNISTNLNYCNAGVKTFLAGEI